MRKEHPCILATKFQASRGTHILKSYTECMLRMHVDVRPSIVKEYCMRIIYIYIHMYTHTHLHVHI